MNQLENLPKFQTHNSLVKLLTFSVGKLKLALPVSKVKKIQKYSPLHSSGTSHVSLTHLGDQEVTVVDLHQKLFKVSQDDLCNDGGYFIISKSLLRNESPVSEHLGIRIMESPSLLDAPIESIRVLPNSYRNADTLEIASHVAVVKSELGVEQTIFILDLQCLV